MLRSVRFHLIFALSTRLLLIAYGAYHDSHFLVKYTDVDYGVFTDAASYVAKGESPYDRPTYRYSPFLAFAMLPNILITEFAGKILFSVTDVLTGYLIFVYLCSDEKQNAKGVLCGSLSWWYNPLCLAVSTRGSAESLMACATVATLLLLKKQRVLLAAIVYGFSVHFKLYTIIYALPIYLSLNDKHPSAPLYYLKRVIPQNRNAIVFASVSAVSFLGSTAMSYYLYGSDYLQEAILYHVSRRDVRHNFSPFFYLLYLTDEWPNSWALAFLTFVPQFLVIILLGFRYGTERDLVLCLFLQTSVFVALNKVCTSQYFLWFLCLLPLLVPRTNLTWRRWTILAVEWFIGQSIWLFAAYLLEFQGLNTFSLIWGSSLIFLFANVHVLLQVHASYKDFQIKSK